MMDPSNRVNPDKVLPPAHLRRGHIRDADEADPEVDPEPERVPTKADLPLVEDLADLKQKVADTRAERRQQVLDQREVAARQTARAQMAARRGTTSPRTPPTTRSGRR